MRNISALKTAGVDAGAAAEGPEAVRAQADADMGLGPVRIDFDHIKYFVRSTEKQAASWDDLPADIKSTYDKLGIPEAEKARLITASPPSTSRRSSTARSARTWRRRAFSSWTPTRPSGSSLSCSGSILPR